jgi:hypothetical protein
MKNDDDPQLWILIIDLDIKTIVYSLENTEIYLIILEKALLIMSKNYLKKGQTATSSKDSHGEWNPYRDCFEDCKDRLIEKLTAIESFIHVSYTIFNGCLENKEDHS